MSGGLFTEGAQLGRPYWWDGVTWPELDGDPPERTEVLVIGAGYTGLSAAIAAHDAGARVVVIDSGLPGEGASTRNGGMLGAHPRLGWDTLAKRYGPGVADALYSEAGEALAWVKDLIRREDIACDFEETGRIQMAYTPGHFETQETLAVQIAEKGGVPCHLLNREALDREIATPLYHGGILFPNHGGVHPAKYLLGMLNVALRRGISVCSHCPAMRITRVKSGHRVTTLRGVIEAEKIILATNGYTGAPFPWHNARVFPVPSYLIATEPLAPDLIAELAPGRRMMVETRALHSYFRISPDGTRILFGGRAALVDIGLRKAARRLRATMSEIWPQLGEVRLSHAWTGNTGYTFRHMPHVGEHDGVHYAMGYSGGGTVLAPWLGRKAALRALGAEGGETAFSETALASRWFYRGGRPVFLQAANLWYRHCVDRRERRSVER